MNIAIVGATGNVGRKILEVLEKKELSIDNLYLLASSRSAGSKINFLGNEHEVLNLETFDFSKAKITFFAAGGKISEKFAEKAAKHSLVIDNSSFYRMDPDVPLIVPQVNSDHLNNIKKNIIANPNCSTAQLVIALKPLHDLFTIKRIVVSTYQSVSGGGKAPMDELIDQTKLILDKKKVQSKNFTKQIAFNAIPHIDVFLENRYTKEEMKMVWETHKILEDDSILVNPTAVRIPVFYGHSEAIHIETSEKISAEKATELLINFQGVQVLDGVKMGEYPTAVTESSGHDPVFVGRIREDISHPTGLNLWVVADNIRKGAALNSVQIAEILADKYL